MKVLEMGEGGNNAMEQEMAGAQDTIYLCNFRVSVDGEWLCLKELQDVEFNMQDSIIQPLSTPSPEIPAPQFGTVPYINYLFIIVPILFCINATSYCRKGSGGY